jgi:hypothetical protein
MASWRAGWLLQAAASCCRRPETALPASCLPQTRETRSNTRLLSAQSCRSGLRHLRQPALRHKGIARTVSVRADSAGASVAPACRARGELERIGGLVHTQRKLAGDCRRACGKIWDFRSVHIVADAASTLWRRCKRAAGSRANWMKIARV